MPDRFEICRDGALVMFFCPGCKEQHTLTVEGPGAWDWNRDLDKATFEQAVCIEFGPKHRCHSYIENGQIRFLDDCTHELAGQTVDVPEIEEVEL